MNGVTISRVARFASLALLVLSLVQGQVERASLAGTVTDTSGAVIPGVTIKVINEGTNTAVNLETDAAGEFRAVNLTPGSYSVSAEKSGFQRYLSKGLVLQVAQEARLDVRLQVGGLEQTVEVNAAPPLLQTEGSTVGQVIDSKPIETLPLNGRNIVQLAVLAPGVTGLSYAQTGTINSGLRPDELRPGGTTLLANGARDSSNQLLLDGIDNTEMISQTFVVRPPVEGVQEFKAITNNAGAEYGRAGGAVLVTSTKSGSNNFHGSAFEYLRNSALDAKNYFDRGDLPIPQYQLNQFGVSLGGPVIRNRTFFFADYEGYREKQGQTKVVTVPTAAAKAGNFAGVARSGIFDPASTAPITSGGVTTYTRVRFPNDVIPASRFDPLAARIVALYPNPQTSGLVNNYISNPEKLSNLDRGDIRIDHQITSKQTFFARYSIDNSDLHIPNTFDTRIGGNEDSFAGPDDVRGHHGVLAYNNVFSPTVIGEYRFGFTKFSQFLLPEQLTDPVWSQIPGRDTSDPFQPSAPIISPSGYVGLGNARSEPLIRREHMFENTANVSWQKGKHAFKFGIDIRQRLISETASPPGQSAFGRFSFTSGFTNNPSSTNGTGDAIASMLLGFPSATIRDFFIPGTAHVRTNEFNYYARDEWRVTDKLTLNLGIHYEVNTPFTEDNNYWVNWNPVTAKLLIAGQNASSTANVNTDFSAIGPRIGIAYQVDRKTVVRGGYGIFYDPQGNYGTTIRQFRQQPFDLVFNTSPGDLFPANSVRQGIPQRSDFPATDPNNPTAAVPNATITAIDPNFRNAQIQQFNFGVQRELAPSTVLTATYVGSLGRRLAWSYGINTPPPGPGAINPRRPYYPVLSNITNINYWESAGNSEFQSLQVVFEKRYSHGLYLNANWVWSHAMDNAPWDGGSGGGQDPYNRRADWGSSNSDVRHRLNLFTTYELPFGQGKRWANSSNPFNRYVVGGWELDAIFVWQSGLPFTVNAPSATNNGTSSRANVVAGVSPYPAVQTLQQWFNPLAFSIPPAACYCYGNSGRDVLTGPRAANLDLTAAKRFRITENSNVAFRAEFFNALNHPQFAIPGNTTIGSNGVGSISSTARTSRQIQFALRFVF
ncbi:MAG: carboxypeptidase regulatory-like domain-containing protein [Bryobacteraceae bacterium]